VFIISFSTHSQTTSVERLSNQQLRTLSNNVVLLRSQSGLTQERLAEKANITARYLQFIEAGTMGGSLPVLIRLKNALGCSWVELLKDL